MIAFLILSTIIFAGLTFIWSKNTVPNFTLKLMFFTMMLFGIYEIMKMGVQQ